MAGNIPAGQTVCCTLVILQRRLKTKTPGTARRARKPPKSTEGAKVFGVNRASAAAVAVCGAIVMTQTEGESLVHSLT